MSLVSLPSIKGGGDPTGRGPFDGLPWHRWAPCPFSLSFLCLLSGFLFFSQTLPCPGTKEDQIPLKQVSPSQDSTSNFPTPFSFHSDVSTNSLSPSAPTKTRKSHVSVSIQGSEHQALVESECNQTSVHQSLIQ